MHRSPAERITEERWVECMIKIIAAVIKGIFAAIAALFGFLFLSNWL